MSHIVKFPNSSRSKTHSDSAVEGEPVGPGQGKHWSLRALQMLLMMARVPVFLVLYWLRTRLVLIGSILSFPMFLLCLFAWYAFPEKPQMYGSFGVVSFTALW